MVICECSDVFKYEIRITQNSTEQNYIDRRISITLTGKFLSPTLSHCTWREHCGRWSKSMLDFIYTFEGLICLKSPVFLSRVLDWLTNGGTGEQKPKRKWRVQTAVQRWMDGRADMQAVWPIRHAANRMQREGENRARRRTGSEWASSRV